MYKSLNPGMVNLKVPFEQAARLAGEYGFGALEFSPLEAISQHGLMAAQDVLGRYGVIIGSFGLPVNVQFGEDAFAASIGELPKHAKAARDLGVHRSCTWIPSWSDELTTAQYRDAMVRRLRACAEVYKDFGISLGLEFLGPQALYVGKKHAFIHTLSDMLALCDEIGTGNLGIMLDAYHVYTAGMDVADALRDFKSEAQIITVHINDAKTGVPIADLPDSPRFLPGEGGGIDVPAFLKSLKDFGYTGPVICEPFSEKLNALTDPDEIMQLLSDAVESVWVG